MTGHQSIAEEAPEREQPTERDSSDSADSTESSDRRKFTQRMPEELVEEIDEFADSHGMSRNAAINLLSKTGLDDF